MANSGFSQVFLNEGFENGGNIPTGWTNEYKIGTQDWTYQSGGHNGHPASAYTGSYNAFLYYTGMTFSKTKLVTPAINFGASPPSVISLEFWHTQEVWSGDQDTLRVYYKTSATGSWVLLQSYTSSIAVWTKETIMLPNPGTSYYIGFEGATDWGYGVCIDDVNVLTPFALDMGATIIVAPLDSICYSSNDSVIATIKNYGSATVDFSNNNCMVGVQISGAITQTITSTIITGTLGANSTMNVFVGMANMSSNGAYYFKPYIAVGDSNNTNDTGIVATRTVVPTVSLAQTCDFTGFTGSNLTNVFPNWREASDIPPSGTSSSWLEGTALGQTTAKINLYATGKDEWIIGPKFTVSPISVLSFKAAVTNWNSSATDIMGSDDEVKVLISTDCGSSWTSVLTIDSTYASNNLSNSLSTITIPLTTYNGSTAIIAFFATEGTVDDAQDYDFHIDDINIMNPSPIDMSAFAVTNPPVSGCYGSNDSVNVTIKNYGSSVINFGSDSCVVGVQITGATTQTLSTTLTSGTLGVGLTMNVYVGTLNMVASGTYNFRPYTIVAGDGNNNNDSGATVTRYVDPTVNLSQTCDFTGFTGTNLTSVFPNWYEAIDIPPSGTTSSWVSSTSLGQTTARVNLYSTGKNEWIIGPKFQVSLNTNLTFKAAVTDWNSSATDIMGSDDEVKVMISTDCGITWASLLTIDSTYAANNLSNSLSTLTIPLSTYNGSTVIIAFFATEGTVDDAQDYDFHIDDINIYNSIPHDAAVVDWISPVSGCGHTANENVTVKVANFGTSAITNVPIAYSIDEGNTIVGPETIAGPINPGDTVIYTFTTKADLTASGRYGSGAATFLSTDGNGNNDTFILEIYSLASIDSYPYTETFDSGYTFTFKLTDNSESQISIDNRAANASSYGLHFQGSTDISGWTGSSTTATPTNAWVDNTTHQASAVTCNIDATNNDYLRTKFDLSQTYSYGNKYSWFRVLINNSIQISDINGDSNFNPTLITDPFTTKIFDLSAYAGSTFTLTLQSSCKYNDSNYNAGDNVFIDNFIIYDSIAVNIGNDTSICSGNTLNLDAGGSPAKGYTYNWVNITTSTPLGTNQTINVSTAGTYAVQLSKGSLNVHDTIVVSIVPFPTADAGANDTICEGANYKLTGIATDYNSLLWTSLGDGSFSNSGVLSPTYYPGTGDISSTSVTLILKASTGVPCIYSAMDSLTITILSSTLADANSDDSICEGDIYTLSGNASNYDSVIWVTQGDGSFDNNTSLTPTYTPGTNDISGGEASLILTAYGNTLCGSIPDTMILSINSNPTVDLGHDSTICANASITMDPGSGFDTYQWSTGSNSQSITIDSSGIGLNSSAIDITVTKDGCNGVDTVIITFEVCTGIDELAAEMTIKIYPNPSNGKFTVSTSGNSEKLILSVLSLTGEELYQRIIKTTKNSHQTELDLSSLSKGMYLFKLMSAADVFVQRFVIE